MRQTDLKRDGGRPNHRGQDWDTQFRLAWLCLFLSGFFHSFDTHIFKLWRVGKISNYYGLPADIIFHKLLHRQSTVSGAEMFLSEWVQYFVVWRHHLTKIRVCCTLSRQVKSERHGRHVLTSPSFVYILRVRENQRTLFSTCKPFIHETQCLQRSYRLHFISCPTCALWAQRCPSRMGIWGEDGAGWKMIKLCCVCGCR